MPLNQRLGGIVMPVAAGDVTNGQLWSVGDPIRDRLLALFSAAITAELTASWNVARVGTKLASVPVLADTLHQQPRRNILREGGYKLPLLALYRTGTAPWANVTLAMRKRTQDWRLDYVLGPLLLEDERRLAGVLPWVPAVVDAVIEARGHSAFEGGAIQFFEDTCPIGQIALTGSEEGLAEWAEGDSKIEFYAASMTLQTVETEWLGDCPDGSADYEGMDHTMNIGGSSPETLF
jgi:hypothetical protein